MTACQEPFQGTGGFVAFTLTGWPFWPSRLVS